MERDASSLHGDTHKKVSHCLKTYLISSSSSFTIKYHETNMKKLNEICMMNKKEKKKKTGNDIVLPVENLCYG